MTVRYDAVTAKVRAMYGARLRGEDYDRLAAMKSVADVAGSLRGHPVWGRALAAADTSSLRRERLEFLLRRYGLSYLLRIFLYTDRGDRSVMRYPVLAAEMEQIMRFIHLASAGSAGEYVPDLPEAFRKLSRIRYDALPSANNYDDFLSAVKGTEYEQSLRRIRPAGGGFPPYLLVETQMRRGYYRSLMSLLRSRSGRAWALLREAAGIQADWNNITMLERILRYYPALKPDIFHYLLPAGAHLRTVELKTMLSLGGADNLRELLQKTWYAPYLAGRGGDTLEKIGKRCLVSFYKRHMACGEPSEFMPIAYVNLYQNELQNLIHTIEGVRYGLPPETIQKYLVAM